MSHPILYVVEVEESPGVWELAYGPSHRPMIHTYYANAAHDYEWIKREWVDQPRARIVEYGRVSDRVSTDPGTPERETLEEIAQACARYCTLSYYELPDESGWALSVPEGLFGTTAGTGPTIRAAALDLRHKLRHRKKAP